MEALGQLHLECLADAKPAGHSVTRLLLGNNIVGNGGARDIARLIRSGAYLRACAHAHLSCMSASSRVCLECLRVM
jgi:hypothetical protein